MTLKQIACTNPARFAQSVTLAKQLGTLLVLFVITSTSQFASQVTQAATYQDQPDQARSVAEIALNAQNSENYSFAAKEWKRLLSSFPDSPLVGKAHLNAGICFMHLSDYPQSIEQFKSALPKLADDDVVQKPLANLYLGFTQLRLGQQLATDPAKKQESTQLLTTATQTFANLLKNYPKFADLDQVCYFQGGAFEDLNRMEDALAAYEKMLTYPKQAFRLDGLQRIGNVYAELGQHSKALGYYAQFRKLAEEENGHPLLNEVLFQTGRSTVQLAIADENAGDNPAATEKFKQAQQILQQVAGIDVTNAEPEVLELVEEAKFQQAYCARQLGQFADAGALYEDIANNPKSPLAGQSLALAGISYNSAGDTALAIDALKRAVASESNYANEAAHWLATLYLKTDPQQAYDLATTWIGKSAADDPILISLLMDQADAALILPQHKQQAGDLFQAIADKYPDDKQAPMALYSAAFAALENDDFQSAIDKADRFQAAYATSPRLSDTLEVKADALFSSNQPDSAKLVFDKLIADFPDSEKIAIWKLRAGSALHLQKKYQETIDQLAPLVDSLTDATNQAEALHWIGSSYYQLKNYPEAISALTRSIAANKKWRGADETLLTLFRSQLDSDQVDAAKATAQQLIDGFPKSPVLSAVYYYLGNQAYDAEQYAEAVKYLDIVTKEYGKSEFAPYALFTAAWSQLELKKYDESEALFSQLIQNFPDTEQAQKAKIGRGTARRVSGNLDASIRDLREYLKTNPEGEPRNNALYEIGLAQVQIAQVKPDKWEDVVETFKQLIAESPESPRIDKYYYELAWAYRALKEEEQAIAYFAKITEEKPESPLAAEANFHVGSAAYEAQDYETAIQSYKVCIQSETADNIREKAAYKLAWAYYKQDQFQLAYDSFVEQTTKFPEGELSADGKFMVAESLFRMKKHDEAYIAYTAAKPVVDAAEAIEPKIKWLTMLHGAQSANKLKKYEEAIALAAPLATSDAELTFRQDAWLELGTAYNGLKKTDDALANFRLAAENLGKTGARAQCMIGDLFFQQKKHEQAVDEFKRVYYGFGGREAPADIRPWQAYAIYEAARCSFIQIDNAPPEGKAKLKQESITQFEYLLEHYGDDKLAKEAKRQLETIKKINLK